MTVTTKKAARAQGKLFGNASQALVKEIYGSMFGKRPQRPSAVKSRLFGSNQSLPLRGERR